MSDFFALLLTLLIFPGILFAVVATLLLSWVRSNGRAYTLGWSSAGQSINLRQLSRRFRQSSTVTDGVHRPVIQILPVIAVMCPLLALILLPFPGNRGTGNPAYTTDVVAVVALLLGMPIVRIILGWVTPSPYTQLAANRSARQLLAYSVPLTLAIASVVALSNAFPLTSIVTHGVPFRFNDRISLVTNIIAGFTYLFCIPMLTHQTSIHEGQGSIELVGSELTELSGKELLVMRLAESIQFVAVIGVGLVLFVLPYLHTDGARILMTIVASIFLALAIGLWEGMAPRLRIFGELQPPISIWLGTPTFLGILSILGVVLAQRFVP